MGELAIRIALELNSEGYALTIEDNGGGVPADFAAGSGSGLGMRVVNLLTRQLGVQIEMPAPGATARFRMLIPSEVIVSPALD